MDTVKFFRACEGEHKNNSVYCLVKEMWISERYCAQCWEKDQANHPKAFKP